MKNKSNSTHELIRISARECPRCDTMFYNDGLTWASRIITDEGLSITICHRCGNSQSNCESELQSFSEDSPKQVKLLHDVKATYVYAAWKLILDFEGIYAELSRGPSWAQKLPKTSILMFKKQIDWINDALDLDNRHVSNKTILGADIWELHWRIRGLIDEWRPHFHQWNSKYPVYMKHQIRTEKWEFYFCRYLAVSRGAVYEGDITHFKTGVQGW